MTWSDFNRLVDRLASPPESYILWGLLALLAVLLLLKRRQPRSVAAFNAEGGRVMVTRSAIAELVHTSCAQLREVAKPAIRIRVKGGQTHLEVRLKLMSGGRLTEVAATLKAHLRQALEQNLGIENLGPIDITVTGFKSGRLPAPKAGAEEEPEPATGEPVEPAEDFGFDVEDEKEKAPDKG